MGMVMIPRSYMGQILQEQDIKRALLVLNPGFHFDVGGNLNIWHPYQAERQGVWYDGRHICSMDRGAIPEVPIWTMVEERISVPTHTLRWADITDPLVFEEFVVAPDGKEIPTGMSSIPRKVRDQVITVGWRHTLNQVLKKKVPGVSQSELERDLRVDLSFKLVDPSEVIESAHHKMRSRVLEVA